MVASYQVVGLVGHGLTSARTLIIYLAYIPRHNWQEFIQFSEEQESAFINLKPIPQHWQWHKSPL